MPEGYNLGTRSNRSLEDEFFNRGGVVDSGGLMEFPETFAFLNSWQSLTKEELRARCIDRIRAELESVRESFGTI